MARRLAIQGASAEDAAQMREMLEQAKAVLSSAWRVHDGDDAELLIIDVDSVYGHMDWLRAHHSRLVAAFTAHASDEYELMLHKPMTLDNFVEVLDNAAERTPDHREPAPVPAAAPPAPKSKAKPAPVVAAPPPPPPPPPAELPGERRLVDWLSDGALVAAVRIHSAGAADLVLDPAHKNYYVEGSLRALAPHCVRTVAHEELHEVNPVDLARLQASGKGQPYSRLLWLGHALGSAGHLAAALSINARYKLSRWPQIEREFPKHFRIATVMMKQPATLAEVAEQSGATLEDVIDFTNAYHAIGYIDVEGAAAASEAGAQRDTGRNAILSRLRNPFSTG
jgi:hypothetical protein